MKLNAKLRLYQELLLAKSIEKNLLCVLPTGLGKTLVAFALAMHTNGKVIFLAPTKPLCMQHRENFLKATDCNEEEAVVYTGETQKEKRKELFADAKIIFATGQTIENEIINRSIDLNEISLIVFDEAHRAVGEYCYVFIARAYIKNSSSPKILALTASPGTDREKIEDICKNLNLNAIEIMDESNKLVEPYLKKKSTHVIKLDFPEELKIIKKNLEECLKKYAQNLKALGLLDSVDLSKVRKSTLLQLQGKLGKQASEGGQVFTELSTTAVCVKAVHCIELLQTQGIDALKEYFKKIRVGQKVKANRTLLTDVNFNRAIVFSEECKTEHPKRNALRDILKQEITGDKKAIVFSNYRDNAKHLADMLEKIDGIKPIIFVGQAGEGGLTQRMQKRILDEFAGGRYNTMIATSIGEEGIDIPKIDVAVFYEPIPSALRSIQRRGRVGRTDIGKVFTFVTKGTIDEAYYWIAHNKEKKMKSALNEIKNEIEKVKQFSVNDFKEFQSD